MAKGDIRVEFFNPADRSPRDMGTQGYLRGVSARGKGYVNKIGNGSVDIAISELAQLDGAYTFLLAYDICVVYLVNGVNNERICSFVVRDVKIGNSAAGKPAFFTLSGPDMLFYLGKKVNTKNIGLKYEGLARATGIGHAHINVPHGNLEDEGYTQAESGGGDPTEWPVFWPKWTLIKAQSSDDGASFVEIPQAWEDAKPGNGHEKWVAGDLISAAWQFTGAAHSHSSITSIVDDGTYYELNLNEPLEHSTRRKEDDGPRYYPLFQPHILKGDHLRIKLSTGAWHYTKCSSNPEFDHIPIEEALPAAVNDYAEIEWWSPRELNTTTDITDIMAGAVSDGWTLVGGPSTNGSSFLVEATSTLSLLEQAAERNGDWFYARQQVADTPEATVVWDKPTATSTGLTLKTAYTQGDAATIVASASHALIHKIDRSSKDFPVGAVIPIPSPEVLDEGLTWNLGNCDESPAAGLLRIFGITTGLTLVTEYVNGAWRVRNTGAELATEERVDYPNVQAANTSFFARTEAANQLQAEAALTLHNRSTYKYEYIVKTSLPDGVEINQGESVVVDYTETSDWLIDNETLYIAEYEHYVNNSGKLRGVRQTKLTLSTEGPFKRLTGATVVAGAIRDALGGGSIAGSGGGVASPPVTGGGSGHDAVTVAASTPTGALTVDGQELTLLIDTGDGIGISVADEIEIDLASSSGLDVSTGLLKMGTPGTLSAATINVVSLTTHAHEITTTDDAETTPSTILAGDANGRIRLDGLGVNTPSTGSGIAIDGDIDFVGAQEISTTAGDLTIAPAGGLLVTANAAFGDSTDLTQAAIKAEATNANDYGLYIVQRADQDASLIRFEDSAGAALILLTKDGDLESGNPGFVSGQTGWQINHLGDAEFNDLVARGEFHASVFVADEMHATSGTLAVMTSGILYDNATLPAATGNTFTVNVKASIATGLCPFAADNIIRMKFMAHDGSALDIWDVYAEVDSVAAIVGRDLANSEPGYFPMTCTWRLGGQAALEIPAKTAIVKWGEVSGSGYVGGIMMTSDLNDAPYIDIFTLPADHTWGVAPVPTPRVREGNLDGVLGLGEEWGLALGTDLSDTSLDAQYIVASDQRMKLNNIDLGIYDSSNNQRILMEADGDVKFGTDVSGASTTMFDFSGVDGVTRIGALASGKGNIYWDGTDMHIRNNTTTVITLKSTGGSYFSGTMEIEAGGEIVAGETVLDDDGITIGSYSYGGSPTVDQQIKFVSGVTDVAAIESSYHTGSGYKTLRMDLDGNVNDYFYLNSFFGTAISSDDYMYLSAPNQGFKMNSTKGISLEGGLHVGGTSPGVFADDGSAQFTGGVIIGNTDVALGSPDTGQLILDQGTGGGRALVILSDYFTEGTTQGMDSANTYFQVGKLHATTGGVFIEGAGESTRGIQIRGSAGALSTTTLGPIILQAMYDNGTGTIGATNVVMSIYNNATQIMRVLGDGDLYIDGTYETYDHLESDVEMVRAVSLMSPSAIRTSFDEYVRYNRDDLEDAGLVAGTMVNTTGMMRLHNGAIWELHKRVAELESRHN